VAAQVPQGKPVRVLVFLSEEPDPPAPRWKDQAAEGVSPEDIGSDTLYDELSGP
jgi:hypothetical protein